jgi:glutaredoxin 3
MTSVTLYTKDTCPYCINAKRLLDNKGVTYTEISVYDLSSEQRAEIAQKTNNYRTVPQIFIGDTFIGGFDNLNELNQTGKLDAMLTA